MQQVFQGMDGQNLIDRIRALKKLTPSEVKIADLLSRRFPEIVFENVTTISQKSSVSKATVVRFISRLGYKNFFEFRNQQRYEVISRLESPIQRYSLKKRQPVEDKKDILGQNFSYIMENLRHTYNQTDQGKFIRVARLIADPRRHLYIMGQRTSYALGYLFYVLLGYLRPTITLLDIQASILPDLLVDVTKKDVLFAITHRRYASMTLKVADCFLEQGAKIILLTDSEFSPLSHLADIQLVVPSDGLSIFQSFCAASALLESLVIAALQFSDDSIYDRGEKAEKLYQRFETFFSGRSSVAGKMSRLAERKGKKGSVKELIGL